MSDPRVVQAMAEIKAIVERPAPAERANAESTQDINKWRIGKHEGRALWSASNVDLESLWTSNRHLGFRLVEFVCNILVSGLAPTSEPRSGAWA